VTLADKMGVLPTDDSPKFSWDSAAGTGAAISAKLMGAIDPDKVFLDKVRQAA
jgi:alanyl-tRNA synthetase